MKNKKRRKPRALNNAPIGACVSCTAPLNGWPIKMNIGFSGCGLIVKEAKQLRDWLTKAIEYLEESER